MTLERGEHEIAFALDKKAEACVRVDLTSQNTANIVCFADFNTIAARVDDVEEERSDTTVSAPVQSEKSEQTSGCGIEIIGLILFLIGLAILGIKFVWRIDFTLVPM